ncbi:hypothetical protein MSAR_21020 [Mycolicibacterium sarraceniae]|uniref:Uncharacterized protein n=1 Tax=Mycolicibacterium sarraceniae TaxID=1534348 RepID=A0A7I7ST22_9MYCO|nr:hypothetical protein MSAR_21020 [Mycolicibacterium sarraceniae]
MHDNGRQGAFDLSQLQGVSGILPTQPRAVAYPQAHDGHHLRSTRVGKRAFKKPAYTWWKGLKRAQLPYHAGVGLPHGCVNARPRSVCQQQTPSFTSEFDCARRTGEDEESENLTSTNAKCCHPN